MQRLLALLLWLCLVSPAIAHKPSDSYLTLAVEGNAVNGQWDIALRDLDFAIGLDSDADGNITWGEVRRRHAAISAYALSHLKIGAQDKDCPLQEVDHLIDSHTDGVYEVLKFKADCPDIARSLQVKYSLFFDIDPQHKGLLRLQSAGATSTAVFSPDSNSKNIALVAQGKLEQFRDYAGQGVWHIWIGFDHILFLMALLLPSVVIRSMQRWQPVSAFWPALISVARIVTAFTVAHSITLSLATLGLVSLPSRVVESSIALSVIVAALNNVWPLFSERRWLMAFLFGLLHGFGFASVLADLGLPPGATAIALVGFNLGVEAGQLAIVAAFLPIAFAIRRTVFYRRLVLIGGSLLIAALASIWLVERVFDIKLITA